LNLLLNSYDLFSAIYQIIKHSGRLTIFWKYRSFKLSLTYQSNIYKDIKILLYGKNDLLKYLKI